MKKNITIIRNEFRRSEEARYIHRLHGVLLVLLGLSTVKAGKLIGDPQRTVAHWMAQWKAQGLKGLRDGEKPGRPGALSAKQKDEVMNALAKTPADYGLKGEIWTGKLLASLLKKHYGITLGARQCFRVLKTFKNAKAVKLND